MRKVTIDSVRKSLPVNLRVTDMQVEKAIEYYYDMVLQYPEKNVLYFINGWSAKKLILQTLAANLFYEKCGKLNAYGYDEIMNVITFKQLPKNICEFYIKTLNGGCDEIDLICSVYKIKNPTNAESIIA